MNLDVPDIIIIRGAPASGKSQTAKSLSKFYPKGVRMEVDTLRQMVISVDWTNQKEHIEILEASTTLVLNFLKLEYRPVIVIDTFSGDKLTAYLKNLKEKDAKLTIKIFGLYAADEELHHRVDLRSENEFKDFEICQKLNRDVLKIKYDSEVQIDTTGKLASETASIITQTLQNEHVAQF